MIRITGISLPITHSDSDLLRAASDRIGVSAEAVSQLRLRRKSVDARRGRVWFVYTVDIEVDDEDAILAAGFKGVGIARSMEYCLPAVSGSTEKKRIIIIGCGPAGLFAGIILAEAGLRPMILERGKKAAERAKDVAEFWNTGRLDSESNALFGEGGAGTFSDGKLTTRIKDKNNHCRKVLDELVAAGSPEEILYMAKPHIGTDILVDVVGNLREKITSLGGKVCFECRVDGVIINDGNACGVVLAGGREISADQIVLAIGHSARDTFKSLYKSGVRFQQKAFSIGARIEHPQQLINKAQYGEFAGHKFLGAAEYQLVHHTKNSRGVYTFCMCPGGAVMGASSEAGGVVTNGMSTYRRDAENANSALLVSVRPEDFESAHPLAGIEFQRKWEKAAFEIAGSNYFAPVQRVEDFLLGRVSSGCGCVEPSYKPGVKYCDISACLPGFAVRAMREAIPEFGRKLWGFDMADALLTASETRSSSPVRIVRGESYESVNTKHLYPAGEGAGYAGGIVSAAVDGIKAAEKIIANYSGRD